METRASLYGIASSASLRVAGTSLQTLSFCALLNFLTGYLVELFRRAEASKAQHDMRTVWEREPLVVICGQDPGLPPATLLRLPAEPFVRPEGLELLHRGAFHPYGKVSARHPDKYRSE